MLKIKTKMSIKNSWYLFIVRASIFLMTACLFYSCDSNRIFESNENIDNGDWSYEDTLVFKTNMEDTISRYNVFLNIRHTKDYEYANLWLKIITTFPNGEIVNTPVDLPIADADGRWYGSGSGSVLSTKLLIQENAIFPNKGEYKWEMVQNMRINPISEIMDVGLTIEKALVNE